MSYRGASTLRGPLHFNGTASPGVSDLGEGRIYYDSGSNTFQVSQNNGAYSALATAASTTLSAVLSAGNTTGANNILMTTGQQIDTATATAVLNLGNTNASALGIGNPSGGASSFQVFINQGGASFSSNAGLQLSSTVANRGSGRFNQFGANTGVPGITGFKSRGTTVGSLAAVADGDILARMTAIGVAPDNASIPLAGFVDIRVPTGGTAGANWVASDFSVSLVPLAGPINSNRQVARITSEAAFELIDGTTATVSPASKGQIRYNNTTKTFQASVDTGAWTSFLTGASTLAAVLAAGNTTGGTDLVVSSTDKIRGVDAATGLDLALRGGNSSGIAAGGAVSITGGTPTEGAGGAINITAANGVTGTATARAGGTVTITRGTGVSGGANGTIQLVGDTTVTGKLTVTGIIDPTALLLSGSTDLYFQSADGSTAAVAPANQGRIRYLNGTGWQVSSNGGAYATISTGAGGLSGITNATPGQLAWSTGSGAITHLLGPTDQNFTMEASSAGASSVGRNLVLRGGPGGSTSGAGGQLRLFGGSAQAGNSAGGDAVLFAGNGSGTSAGGAFSLNGGQGGSTGNGGLVDIRGGPGGSTSGNGGDVNLTGGSPTSGNGGSVNLAGRDALGAGLGGSVSIQAGTSTTGLNAGSVSISAGFTSGAGAGGSISGTAGASATGTAGSITWTAGAGGTTSGAGGIFSGIGGAGTAGNSAGGVSQIVGGAGQGTAPGGEAQVTGGVGGATGDGGACNILAGNGGATSGNAGSVGISGGTPTNGNGGSITITGTSGVGTNRNGGSITNVLGAASGAGTNGSFAIQNAATNVLFRIAYDGTPSFRGPNTTGAGTALLAANCPAVDPTTPYAWLTLVLADGSTVYTPVWK